MRNILTNQDCYLFKIVCRTDYSMINSLQLSYWVCFGAFCKQCQLHMYNHYKYGQSLNDWYLDFHYVPLSKLFIFYILAFKPKIYTKNIFLYIPFKLHICPLVEHSFHVSRQNQILEILAIVDLLEVSGAKRKTLLTKTLNNQNP